MLGTALLFALAVVRREVALSTGGGALLAAVGYATWAVVSALFDVYDTHGTKGVLTTDGVVHSLTETVPLSKTMKEKIAALRTWCKTRARPASSAYETETKDATRKLETA